MTNNPLIKLCKVHGLLMALLPTTVALLSLQGSLSGHGQIARMEIVHHCMPSAGEKAGSEHILKEAQPRKLILSGQEIDEMRGNSQNRDNNKDKIQSLDLLNLLCQGKRDCTNTTKLPKVDLDPLYTFSQADFVSGKIPVITQ